MAFGGALSLADRRLRIGAPVRANGRRARSRRESSDESAARSSSPLALIVAAAALAPCSPTRCMKDPALEARARALSAELRCMVCQNQSIDDSDARWRVTSAC